MYIDENSPKTIVLALNGEFVENIIEADTTDGYIIQAAAKPVKKLHRVSNRKSSAVSTDLQENILRKGRVDFLGDRALDSSRIILERLNRVRLELGLDPYELPPFLDE